MQKTYSIYVQVDESFKLILFTKHAKQLFCHLIKLTGRGSINNASHNTKLLRLRGIFKTKICLSRVHAL